ncbi:MAG: hypothetical protein QOI20_3285 [Acidimicrobiaceae bacterium]|jgi:lambda family phage tail tape measure protein|nr:hypothetical protein [Acidimicrobiaceae bacterium]
MSFTITVKADTKGAQSDVAGLERALDRAETKGNQLRNSLGRFTKAGAGIDGAKRAADGLSTSMQKAEQSAHGLHGQITGLAAALGVYAAAHKALAVVDTYTEVGNRLRNVAHDQDNLNGLMDASFRVAQDTRTEWEEVANVYQRVAKATESMGVSQREAMDLTKEISQAMAISGATQQEAAMTMMELTHAFELGKLTGREFKVVLKDATPVIGLLAKYSNHTRAEFVEMGKHGKISAELLRDAFKKAGPEIQAQFDKLVPTSHQAFTLITNAAEKFFGEAGAGSGVLKALTGAVKFVADHFETFGKVLLGVGEALIGLYVIDKIIGLVRALTVAIAANPLGALLIAVTTGIMLLRQFGDSLNTHQRVWQNVAGTYVTVGDYLRALWDMIKQLGAAVVDFVQNAWSSLTGAFSNGLDAGGIEFSLRNVLVFIASFVDAAIALFKALKTTIIAVFGGIPAVIGEAFFYLATAISEMFGKIVNTVIDAYNTLNSLAHKAIDPVQAATSRAVTASQLNDLVTQEQAAGRLPKQAPRSTGFRREDLSAAQQAEWDKIRAREQQRNAEAAGAGQVARVDWSIKNPFEGAHTAMKDMLKDAWGKDFGSDVAKDWASNFVDQWDKAARDKAVERLNNAPKAGTVHDKGETPGAKPPDDAAIKAALKLRKELDALLAKSNPMVEAEQKFAKGVDVTRRALDAKIISMEDANAALSDLSTQLRDARFPFEKWVTDIRAETAALALSSNERERANQIRAVENDLRQKGVAIAADIQADIAREIDAQRGAAAAAQLQEERQKELQSALERIKGPTWEYNQGLSIARELMRDNAITAVEYQKELDRLTKAYTDVQNAADKSVEGGLRTGWNTILTDLTNVSKAAEDLAVNAFKGIEDAIVKLVQTGKLEWRSLVDAMIGDITRLIIRMAALAVIKAIATGGSSVAVSGGGGMATALMGAGTGAKFMVRGQGGTDSVPVSFMASPGERVTVETPSEQQRSDGGRGGSGDVHITNVFSHEEMVKAMNTPAGQRMVLNVIKDNRTALRNFLNGR